MTMPMSKKSLAEHDATISQWARAGAMFGVSPARSCPDLERLLLATAVHARHDSRLFIMAHSWLCRYGELVAKHRLRQRIIDGLPRVHWPVLGLLFDLVRHQTKSPRFNAVVKACAGAALPEPQPLFGVESELSSVRRMVERDALAVSRPWHLWLRPFALKNDALRPAEWIMDQNAGWRLRAELKGDLRASIVVELQHDAAAGRSEMELARRTGATRAAVRAALAGLVLTGRVERMSVGMGHAARLRSSKVA